LQAVKCTPNGEQIKKRVKDFCIQQESFCFYSIEVLHNYNKTYNYAKGVVMPIEKDVLKLNDKYFIKSSNHAIQGTKETVSIKIEKFEETL